jgi:hypothetical protein
VRVFPAHYLGVSAPRREAVEDLDLLLRFTCNEGKERECKYEDNKNLPDNIS